MNLINIINQINIQLMADLMEKRAPFNGMRGKRGEELVSQHQPDQVQLHLPGQVEEHQPYQVTDVTSQTDFKVR